MDASALLGGAARAALFAMLLLVVGAVTFRWVVLPRSGEGDGAARSAAARVGAGAAALLLPALLALLAAQLIAFRDPTEPLASEAALLLSLPWGRIWLLQAAAAVLLAVAFALTRRGSEAGWAAAVPLALLLAFTPALSGHAAAVEGPTALAVAADGTHVIAAGSWLGTLVVLARASLRPAVAPGVLLARLAAFSPVALASAAAVAATGAVGAWLHLPGVAALWTSPYGRLLSLKLLLFAAVAALGAYNWRRATPRLRERGDTAALARAVRAELGTGLLVLLVTAWFVATSPP